MTARDEAIYAVSDALHFDEYGSSAESVADEGLTSLAVAIVDAIPPGVLARLAIEQGALTQAGLSDTAKAVGLYRVVEP